MSILHDLRASLAPVARGLAPQPAPGAPIEVPERYAWRRTMPWRSLALQAAGMWLASRAAILVFTYFAVILNHQGTNVPPNLHAYGPSDLLNAWSQWDVRWYQAIVVHGYKDWLSTAFFPFFPMLTWLPTAVVGKAHVLGTLMAISNLGTLVAFIAIGWLAAWEFGPRVSRFAVLAAAAYPFMFFTVAGYADSWFLAWVALSLLFARRGLWPWAAGFAFMASVTRPTALVLIAPLVWEYVRQLRARGVQSRQDLTPRMIVGAAAVLLCVPLGFAIYGVYLWTTFGDPFEWVKAQAHWDHHNVMPWTWVSTAIQRLHDTPGWSFPQARLLMDIGAVVSFAVLTVLGARRLPSALTVYMVAVIGILVTAAVPSDFDPFNAESRYLIMAAPAFVLLGQWLPRKPWLEMLVVGGGFLLQGAFTMYWLRHGWIV